MSGEIYQIETRRRSRSKTPLVLSSLNHETYGRAHEKTGVQQIKKATAARSVQTIVEESIEVTSSSSCLTAHTVQQKRTSIEATMPSYKQTAKQAVNTTAFSSAKGVSISKNNWENIGLASSTPKHKQNEEEQNELNEKQLQSQRKPDNNFSFLQSTDSNSTDHLAYLEYKRAGEYWNLTPKTDYTYSELSTYRRELAPGIVAMPNMSRRSLEIHDDRLAAMISVNPAQENFIRRRYDSKYNKRNEYSKDSVDKTDFNSLQFKRNCYEMQNWFVRMILKILTSVAYIWSNNYSENTPKKSLFNSIASGVSNGFLKIFRYIYILISTVLCVDIRLLKSSNAYKNSSKPFLVLLLIAFPLLLICAWLSLSEDNRLDYVKETQKLLPLTMLINLPGKIAGAAFNNLFQVSSWRLSKNEPETIDVHIKNLEQSMSKFISPEEYKHVLNHINNYVQQLVVLQLKEQHRDEQLSQNLTTQQIDLIEQIISKNLNEFKRDQHASTESELKEADINRIVEKIQSQLEDQNRPVQNLKSLNHEQILEIKNLIYQERQTLSLTENLDLAKLLEVIFKSDYWIQYSNEQAKVLNDLSNDIASVKLGLSKNNNDLEQLLSKFKLEVDELLNRLLNYESSTDNKLSNLVTEINKRLSSLNDTQLSLVKKHVKQSLIDILGLNNKNNNSINTNEDLQNWIPSLFKDKDHFEKRLQEFSESTSNGIKDAIEQFRTLIMDDINERLKNEMLIETNFNKSFVVIKEKILEAISEHEIKNIVKSLLSIYDADKTGLVDFALESAGGQILSTRCTESYQTKSAQISIFGVPLWYPTNTPRVAISPSVQPGECWAFQSFPGFLVLQLNTLIYITGFTLEHIPKSLSPTGRIDSAPRNFTVWGLEYDKDQDPVLFGEYEYADNDASLQYFAVQNKTIKVPYQIVELRIETNHGNPTYTCLYRFRVHGKPPEN